MAGGAASENGSMTDEEQIVALFEEGDRALMAADSEAMRRIYAEDYIQRDEAGQFSSRSEVIARLTSGRIRFLSMRSTGRKVQLLGDFAIVHGSEEDEIEEGDRRFVVRYLYMDVVTKRGGQWQIVGSQLVRL